MGRGTGGGAVWPRVLGLLVVSLALAVLQPILVMGVPFVLLVMIRPGEGWGPVVLAGLLLALGFTGSPTTGLWYVERGWAVLVGGWFVAVTLAWPNESFTPRALAALAGAVMWAGALFFVWPEGWTVTDWVVSERILQGSAVTLEALRTFRGEEVLSAALVAAVQQAAEIQGRLFPALLGLSTVAALAVAWWAYRRLTFGKSDGLGSLTGFRFHDQLVWVLVAGILLVLWGWGEGWSRAGENIVVFMGALYALRGLAVMAAMAGGVSIAGFALAALAMLLAAPMVFAGALALGLGDTWFDLRSRLSSRGGGPESNGTS